MIDLGIPIAPSSSSCLCVTTTTTGMGGNLHNTPSLYHRDATLLDVNNIVLCSCDWDPLPAHSPSEQCWSSRVVPRWHPRPVILLKCWTFFVPSSSSSAKFLYSSKRARVNLITTFIFDVQVFNLLSNLKSIRVSLLSLSYRHAFCMEAL